VSLQTGQIVRFLQDSRFSEWRKGTTATIERVIATPPCNLRTLVVVVFDDGRRAWAVDSDFEVFDQLALF
jgi:hypothetical protein